MNARILSLLIVAGMSAVALAAPGVLLCPDSTTDTVGMFDPIDGSYIGVFCTVPLMFGSSATPINAVGGPDGNVYVSDQVQDAIFKFDASGTFLSVFADASDGLDNVRGIAWRGNELFVTQDPTGTANDAIARFAMNGARLANFINAENGFDIHFLPDGRALLADDPQNVVELYDANGNFLSSVFTVSFPEQINDDSLLPGAYLNASFTSNRITDFDVSGAIAGTFSYSGGRGIYRLGNGNFLASNGSGVSELNGATGAPIALEFAGQSRFIEYFPEPASLLLLSLLGAGAMRRR